MRQPFTKPAKLGLHPYMAIMVGLVVFGKLTAVVLLVMPRLASVPLLLLTSASEIPPLKIWARPVCFHDTVKPMPRETKT